MTTTTTATDPAVRSIMIAETLLDRLAELIKPRRSTALKGLLAPELASDDLDLRLGEAQQITPEIWRHLDTARDAMAARGLRVAGYDEIRTIRDPSMLAATDIHVERKLDTLGLLLGDLRIVTSKSVKWDARTIMTAIAGVGILKVNLPDVDWAALERERDAEIASVGSLRTARWKTTAKWAVGVAVLAGVLFGAYVVVSRNAEPTTAAAATATRPSPQNQVKHAAKIAELTRKYEASPCDRDTMRALTAYLFADGQQAASHAIEEKFLASCPH
jgi:hypothetical protein